MVLGQIHGPVFLLEPPSQLTFSNNSGSQVSCSAHGSPNPQVEWLLQDGQTVSAVPGLRQSLGNGTLYFPPFRAEDYRKDVHSTMYRCRASNLAGSILSREVQVRAVVNQHYDVQVYHTHVQAGNTALLNCVIPAYVKEYVTVTSWSRDDSILLPGSNMGGRIVVTYGTGDLYIKSSRAEDGLARYSCLTLHVLTQERKRSAPAILTITEPTGSMPPRLAPSVQTEWSADRETDVHLTCPAQGNPPPTFNWYRELNGQQQAVYSSPRYELLQDILLIKHLKIEDAGRWTCKVSNHFGEQKLEIHLTVTGHLSVHILPQLQVINSGETSMFNCSVSGSPIGRVDWYRNGEPLFLEDNGGESRISLLNPLTLAVQGVTRHDRGMYQCAVRNERENAQGSAELRLGDTVPELQYTFIEQALRPGPQVSLRCSATGSPPPQFRWLLDGIPLSELSVGHRYAIGQYVDDGGDVISHLNISNVRVEDGGQYTCRAINSLGSGQHAARLNIYGPPFIRSVGPVKAVATTDVTLHCPYAGYPIASVTWKRHGQDLPLDLRHRLEDGGSLTIGRLDPAADSDTYTCLVASREGDTAHRNIQLIVHSPPVLEPFSFPASLQEGGRAQVTCYITSGDMPIHFAWYKDDVAISSSLQVEERAAEFYSMLIFSEVSSRHSGAYTCVASNSAAKSNYTAHLMVKVAPQWVLEPQDISILLGSALTINCEAKGFPHPQITWMRGEGKTSADYQPLLAGHNNGRSVLLGNGSIWFESVNAEDEGHYLCRATNGIGSGLGKVVFLSVNEPARFDEPSNNVSTRRGGPVTLVCDVHGDTPLEITWSLNNNKLDAHNYRYSLTETKTESGVRAHIGIAHADREDTGEYRCRAENSFGRGEHTIQLAVQERPDSPSHLEIIEVGGRAVRIAWQRPFNGNSPITAYLVQYQPLLLSHGNWNFSRAHNLSLPVQHSNGPHIHNAPPQSETALINDLRPATSYRIRMLAVNGIDLSAFTEDVVVRTQEEPPAEAPGNVNVEPVGAGELYVTWMVPPREVWNGELLGYIVNWHEHGKPMNGTSSHTVKGWATTKVQLTGLRKYTRYDITVCAFNSVASGPLSVTVVGTTKEGVPESPPLNITCSQISSQSMKISWIPPPINMHGGLILGYKVYYRPIIIDTVDIPTKGEVKRTSSTETYLHSLYKYTNYSVKVLAYTSAGDGILSQSLICTTEADVPGPPANIKASALTGESILVSWLPPQKPNGRIIHYMVYAREMGRVGKHTFYTVRSEDGVPISTQQQQQHQLMFEIRNLAELQTYEFWVSATTSIGEGEPTTVVTQTTNSRAPSKIASFSQVLFRAVRSRVLLPCLAVGNPTPRTRWIYRDMTITFSPHYEVTPDGHLNIHSADQSLAGNYTCSAMNLFGEDNITYSLNVLLPPSPPQLEVQFTTATTIRLHWKQPEDGGAIIQGYTISSKRDTDDWTTMDISPEHNVYTFDHLQCGCVFHIYILAYNRVGKGSPSPIITAHTKGGPPHLPKERDLIQANATSVQMNLFSWPDGGCPISHFSIMYRMIHQEKWTLVSSSATSDKLLVQDLTPATWYQFKVTAENDAGAMHGLFTFATTTLIGGRIPPPPNLTEDRAADNDGFYRKAYIVTPTISVLILLVCVVLLWWQVHKKQHRDKETVSSELQQPVQTDEQSEKSVERENRRNCQQVYTSSPIKPEEKLSDDAAGMYEISPYATFSVPANQNRSVTTSTLDYTMQFKTFGHIEDNEAVLYAKNPSGKSWHKARYYNNEGIAQSSSRLRAAASRAMAARAAGDSESDDTSGSPPPPPPLIGAGDGYQSSSSNYRVPIKQRGRSEDLVAGGCAGSGNGGGGGSGANGNNPTGGQAVSSTESNEMTSPVLERRHHTPRHLSGGGGGAGAGSRHHQRQRQQHQHQVMHHVAHHHQQLQQQQQQQQPHLHRPSSISSSEDEQHHTTALSFSNSPGHDHYHHHHQQHLIQQQITSLSACSSLTDLQGLGSPTGVIGIIVPGINGQGGGGAPCAFNDSREFSEAECDRDHHLAIAAAAAAAATATAQQVQVTTAVTSPGKLSAELAALLARYQEQKEQERKEFTIHV